MADKRYAGVSALSAIFSQIKAAINEKVTKVSGKDVVNVDVENLLCDEQTDGNYVLTAVVSSGIPTYNWGEGVPGGGSFTDITYEDWLLLTPQEQAAKDYYISDYPSSPLTAGIIGYDNTDSGMDADDVQEAIDEINGGLTNIADDVQLNTNDLTTSSRSKNVFDKNSVEIGYLVPETGAITPNTSWRLSNHIMVNAGENYVMSGITHLGASNHSVGFYDSSKTFVSATSLSSSQMTFTVPSGISFVRFDMKTDDINTAQLEKGNTATSYTPYVSSVESRIEDLESDVDAINSNLASLKYALIAESLATGTHAEKLASLATAYSNLTISQKISSVIVFAGQSALRNVSINGLFATEYLEANKTEVTMAKLSGEYLSSVNGTVNDYSSVSNQLKFALWAAL